MKTYVDKELCIGCGLCESSCPEIYEMKDNIAAVKVDVVPENQIECMKQMVKDCPVDAIKLVTI